MKQYRIVKNGVGRYRVQYLTIFGNWKNVKYGRISNLHYTLRDAMDELDNLTLAKIWEVVEPIKSVKQR